ncbi:MAG: hypothetical protein KIT48_12130 [Pseudolabrys sp.]|nr:hypothetical protein [Pseudolabrys sp.]
MSLAIVCAGNSAAMVRHERVFGRTPLVSPSALASGGRRPLVIKGDDMSKISWASARRNEREFPNIVEIPVPDGGLGSRANAILAWHRRHGLISHRGTVRREADAYFVRWCFADDEDAATFALEFVGELIAAP